MVNVAIVGLGPIGNVHARCYRDRLECKIVAVCDIRKDRADQAATDYGAPAFYSVQEMLAAGLPITHASMCTAGKENGGDHYTPTMELLNAGIHVLGEKPISNEVAKAKEMVALARSKGVRYGIDLNHRFTPAARRAKEWLDAGRCGELNMINMHMWINSPMESSPHFHIRALHPHSIDVMRYFGGPVRKVHAFFKRGPGRVCWSNVHVNMLFAGGAIGHLMGSYDGGGPGHPWGLETCEIIGYDARIILEEACERLHFQPRKTLAAESYHHVGEMLNFGDTFASRIGRWVEQNEANVDPAVIEGSGAEALAAQQVIEAAIESWDTSRVVDLS